MQLYSRTWKKQIIVGLVIFLMGIVSVTPSIAQFKTYKGTGDDILIVEKPEEGMPALLVIKGNSASSHFSITSFDASRDMLDLLVNTTEFYSGIVAVDLPVGTETTMLEVTATGSWSVEVYSIGASPKISKIKPKSDSGDNVLWIEGDASIAIITGNSKASHFAVEAYDSNGRYSDLLVNTTERYSGKVLIPKNTLLLKITATGSWSIELK